MKTTTVQRTLAVFGAAALAVTAIACANDEAAEGEKDDSNQNAMVEEIHNMLPDDIKDAGVIKVGTEAYYPPYDLFAEDDETIIGLDPDIVHALGDVLGVEMQIENMAFDGLLPALEAGRFDMLTGALGTTEERIEKYDFVSYFKAVQGITTVADNPHNIQSKEDLCGLNVAVLDASYQLGLLEEFNEDMCASDPMDIQAFPSDSDALMQLQNGRADAHIAQYPVAVYNAQNFGGGESFEVVGDDSFGAQLLGKIFRKDTPELRDAVQAAMNELIENGTYQDILDDHGLAEGAIDESVINVVLD